MKIGFALPNIGPIGTVESVTKVAQRAETLGYNSLWTVERLLWPLKPQTPYAVTRDGSLPEAYKHTLDPLEALTFAAALTKKIRLGPSVLDMPYYNPVTLARRLSTIDILSNGRLNVGLGLGWSKDEMEASGAAPKNRGAMADEFLRVLKAIWTTDPVEFHGKFYSVPRSYINAKPIQKPHPPIYMSAFVPAALKRVATEADGWNPVVLPVAAMEQMFGSVKQMAKEAGRDPASLSLVVRANLEVTEKSLGADRTIFTGSMEQIAADVRDCAKIGATEVFFDPTFAAEGQSLGYWMSLLDELKGMMSLS